jgi:outer membrane lipoprotein carrier protein
MRFRSEIFVAVLVLALCAPSLVFAQAITKRIQARYESIDAFTTEFTQELVNAASKEKELREGVISFKQPRLIRWETVSPEKELLVVGKEQVWNYFPEDAVAYLYPVDQIFDSKTMLRFISGEANLETDFTVEEQGKEAGLVKLKLVPRKPEPNLVLAHVWVDPDSALLRRVQLVDFFGNTNQLSFKNTKVSVELPGTLFTFVPPKGVEILKN